MRKVILSIFLLFVLVFLTLYLIGRYDNRIDMKKMLDLNIVRIKCDSKFSNLDCLFLGGSHTYSAMYPPLFDSAGIKTYNLGVATGGVYYLDMLLNDYVNATHTTPRCVVMDLSPITFSFQADDFVEYPVHRYLNKPMSNEYYCLKYNWSPKSYISMGFKSFKTALDQLTSGVRNVNHESEFAEMVRVKGFYKSELVCSDSIIQNDKSFYVPLEKAEFNIEKEKYLLDWIEKWKDKTHLVFQCIPDNLLDQFFSADFMNQYHSLLEKLKENKGITFIETTDTYDSSYFRNIDHMNYKGALRYSKQFIITLKQLNLVQNQQRH